MITRRRIVTVAASLAALMAYEKIGRHGQAVATTAGVMALALALLVTHHPPCLPRSWRASGEATPGTYRVRNVIRYAVAARQGG